MDKIISDDWLMGFIEGEGCFFIGNYVRQIRYNFVLANKDKKILEEIKTLLHSRGIETICLCPNGDSNWQLAIQSLSDCLKFAEILDKIDWHTHKREEFVRWFDCMKILKDFPKHSKLGEKQRAIKDKVIPRRQCSCQIRI